MAEASIQQQRAEFMSIWIDEAPPPERIRIALKATPTTFVEISQARTAPWDNVATGGYPPRLKLQSANRSIALEGKSEGTIVYRFRPVGDPEDTPVLAGLLKGENTWQMQKIPGGDWVPCRPIQITANQIGWEILVEVAPV